MSLKITKVQFGCNILTYNLKEAVSNYYNSKTLRFLGTISKRSTSSVDTT